jgi:dihydroflavonol-4-reductase
MTTVVTGASGHVGVNLVRALIDKNRSVRALVHEHRQSLEGVDVDIVCGDVCDLDSLRCAFNGAEVVYHLAARISISMDDWPLLETVNVGGTRNVVEACITCGVRRLIYFGSIHALVQEPLDIPIDESRPLAENDCIPYSRSKALACKEVINGLTRGLDAIILIPTGIIGPHDYQLSHFGEVLLSLACGRLPALVNSGFDWVDVRDIVECAIRAEQHAPRGAHYLLSGHWVSLCEVASLVAEVTGIPAPRIVLPMLLARIGIPVFSALYRVSGRRPLYTRGSIESLSGNPRISHHRATHDLGYQPRPFWETIIDTLRWFEETGQLKQPLVLQSTE